MKENGTKKEIYGLIVETAHELFIEHGIKDVKMDDIAAKLSISKRTIYELFNDKEELLREVLKLQNEMMQERGKEIIKIQNMQPALVKRDNFIGKVVIFS